jgi:hypothetical protein
MKGTVQCIGSTNKVGVCRDGYIMETSVYTRLLRCVASLYCLHQFRFLDGAF